MLNISSSYLRDCVRYNHVHVVHYCFIFILIWLFLCDRAFAGDAYLEPSTGLWLGNSSAATWSGAYGEAALLVEQNEDGYTYYPGIITTISYNNGESSNAYQWDGLVVGTGPIFQYYKGDAWHSSYQWQGKCQIQYEQLRGGNNGYEKDQDTILGYLYIDYLKRENNQWTWGISAEGRSQLAASMTSTYDKDVKDNRNMANVGLFLQNEPLNAASFYRLTANGFYQGWNKKYGASIAFDIRVLEKYIYSFKVYETADEVSIIGSMTIYFGKLLLSPI